MTTAYNFDAKDIRRTFDDLPENVISARTAEKFVFDVYREEIDYPLLFELFKEIVEEGQTYPQDTIDEKTFRQYFLSHNCFVFRLQESNKTVGGFYIKPNFPGRSSHLANFGMAIKSEYRGHGLGKLMVPRAIKYAKIVGYEALYTNLVFVTNPASVQVCKENGFVEVGRLPRAGNLKGLGFTDALQLYRDLR
ncbi:N-acetyltransferase MPR1-like [Bradysia coprophila]|uniref:N-acetyltransferase MPR1-like n=1 Tax=Bradysia coprophila TaxID=38358 RepID=UPI00187D7FE7|nr:N-acetyltransferase MPR1-like [Bradysia coprophila]